MDHTGKYGSTQDQFEIRLKCKGLLRRVTKDLLLTSVFKEGVIRVLVLV